LYIDGENTSFTANDGGTFGGMGTGTSDLHIGRRTDGATFFNGTMDEVTLLDICFGLGYNTAAALDTIRRNNPSCKIQVICLENDESVLGDLQDINAEFEHYHIIKEAAANKHYAKDGIHIEIVMGNALDTIKNLDNQFDAVFLDPFSPKKCPELWTQEFFEDIKKQMKPGSLMATYSCATLVRQNLRDVGFHVLNGPIFGRKAPSTLALKGLI